MVYFYSKNRSAIKRISHWHEQQYSCSCPLKCYCGWMEARYISMHISCFHLGEVLDQAELVYSGRGQISACQYRGGGSFLFLSRNDKQDVCGRPASSPPIAGEPSLLRCSYVPCLVLNSQRVVSHVILYSARQCCSCPQFYREKKLKVKELK